MTSHAGSQEDGGERKGDASIPGAEVGDAPDDVMANKSGGDVFPKLTETMVVHFAQVNYISRISERCTDFFFF